MGQIYIFKGKKHGTGKEYCIIGSVIFEGNYKYGLKNGLRKDNNERIIKKILIYHNKEILLILI